jgi:hypothetical protein
MIRAFQSIRGRILKRSVGLGSSSADSISQSLGWRGKDALLDLQALTAQERKLRVRSFILACMNCERLVGESAWHCVNVFLSRRSWG